MEGLVRRSVLLFAVALSGCSHISPGLHMKESALEGRGEQGADVKVLPITPALLVEQAGARARAAGARPADPLAETLAGYQYRVAPYDVLSIIVWDHPELTIPAGEYRPPEQTGNPVNADGTMFYPHVGVVEVAGKTLPEIRALLTERLRKYVANPQLDVRVAAFRGKRFQVTGEVVQPSTLPVTDVPVRVQDAIASAKGLTKDAWTRGVTLTRAGRTYALDLQALYEEGDVSQNWLLQDGDILNVPSREQNKVFVLGEVRKPSSKLMAKGRMSLAEAIGDSEGFDPITSNPGEVYVLRGRYEAPRVFKLDASSADALLLAVQFQLEPYDVVFVSQYKLTDWNRVMTQILPTVQGIWQTVDVGNRTGAY
ncbi:Polysaccharide export protein [Anaeromyxobacter dehalogenans 2CP-C]|uniref:Polysaccharide export protein n=1 Tax=Anaeromyxobacter dehalogenans (strain 2CP-C) TaxID=290397 RepID=Q2IHI1_ANADE|nr:Polysaccharide export protein [Anaeromyxobacter dehalogenans 2CP-C]